MHCLLERGSRGTRTCQSLSRGTTSLRSGPKKRRKVSYALVSCKGRSEEESDVWSPVDGEIRLERLVPSHVAFNIERSVYVDLSVPSIARQKAGSCFLNIVVCGGTIGGTGAENLRGVVVECAARLQKLIS